GCGAKTAAGYGSFRPEGEQPGRPHTRSVHVALVTPGFVGEADRQSCRLRSASVKALLRRWWRAARGHLDVAALQAGETEVFGSIDRGGRLIVRTASQRGTPQLLSRGQDMGPGGSPLGYLGYGPVAYNRDRRRNLTQLDALDV